MSARHAEEGSQPCHHSLLEPARHRRRVRMEQVLVQRGGPLRARPGHPGRRRVHVREEAGIAEPARAADHGRREPLERGELAGTFARERGGQIE